MAPKRPIARLRALLALAVGVGLLAAPLAAVTPAQAAPVTGFNPGNIIADSVFYDGNAMNAAQVQAFLNGKVPRCTIGDPGRAPGTPIYGSTVAKSCLRNFTMSTSSRAANQICAAYPGAVGESAAQIIAKVGKACGISPKVLLVMLEKEQTLVSDDWPTVRQFNVAMGYACPDSGPGNSANCDSAYYGFFNQVYWGAWQLKKYRISGPFNFVPGKTNTIQWNPNAGCGTSQVYIQNWATASLYIYTPYRPNQAAINAGWGTGDSCSSYGNRNFYLFFTSWFGSTQLPYPVDGGILSYWQANNGWLGAPTAAPVSSTANGGGRTQQFAGGIVYEPKSGQPSGMTRTSPLFIAYGNAGGPAGSWGWPIAPGVNQGGSGNTVMRFQSGSVVEAKGVGVFLVPEALRVVWEQSGGFNGSVGYPLKNSGKSSSGALGQDFKKGTIVSSSAGGARVVDARFLTAWRALGGLSAAAGVPVGAPATSTANGGGTTYPLQAGTMYLSPGGSSTLVAGRYRNAYDATGGVGGTFGWPIGPMQCQLAGDGCATPFQFGVGLWSGASGLVKVSPKAYTAWKPSAAKLGYPKAPAAAVGTGESAGTVQRFAAGDIYESKAGAFVLPDGKLRDGYLAAGGPTGAWGWPKGAATCSADGTKCSMAFAAGTATWTATGGLDFVRDLQSVPKQRISGGDRFETAVEASKAGYPATAGTVLIANGLDYPDALSAGALGAKWKAPLLLARPTSLPASTRAEIVRLKPNRIVVVGGTGAVSDGVVTELKKLAGRVDRVSGPDRYATSVAIAQQGWPTGTASQAFLATGTGFADALAAGAAAGVVNAPVLLVPGNASSAPASVTAELSRLGVTQVRIAGGTGAVSTGVQNSVAAGRSVVRYAGVDRYDTSARIANGIIAKGAGVDVYWANGLGFADALAGGAVAGSRGAPLLLTTSSCVPGSVFDATGRVVGNRILLLGGAGVLDGGVLAGRRCQS
ncbi:cell wall-binding repeat-containing protein [Leucobacter iarius]|uniref:Cell wall binding repeat protein n=1 Tax=Leucobacter iarius TaxID=333963 RepID=A0ABP4XF69_9MICO